MLSFLSFLFDSIRPKGLILTLWLLLQELHKTDQVWETSDEFHQSSFKVVIASFDVKQ